MTLRLWSCICGPAGQWHLEAGNLSCSAELFKGKPSLISLRLFWSCSWRDQLPNLRHFPTGGLSPVFGLTSPNFSHRTKHHECGSCCCSWAVTCFQEGQNRRMWGLGEMSKFHNLSFHTETPNFSSPLLSYHQCAYSYVVDFSLFSCVILNAVIDMSDSTNSNIPVFN